jgi:hypothetical protein
MRRGLCHDGRRTGWQVLTTQGLTIHRGGVTSAEWLCLGNAWATSLTTSQRVPYLAPCPGGMPF